MEKLYKSRYVHKISPRDDDLGPEIMLDVDALRTDAKISPALLRRTLGKILRDAKMLVRGGRVREARIAADGKVVCFPEASIWHAIILTRKE